MKKHLTRLLIPFPFLLITAALSAAIIWKPTDVDAALAWNLAIIFAPLLALAAQWNLARERQFQMVTVLTVIAMVNTSIVLGSRLGAWTGNDWIQALSGAGLPDLPGKTVMGGLILMLLLYWGLKRWWKLPAGLADVLVLGLPLAAVSGRVGCLLAGCCYGTPTNSNWGIAYGPGTPAFMQHMESGILAEGAISSALLYPIQLILIGGNLLIFIALWLLRKKLSRPGLIAFLGFGLLTLQRFGIEFLRDVATNRGSFGIMAGGLKMGQWVVLMMAVASLAGFCYLQFFQQKNTPEPAPESAGVPTARLAYALGGITLGSFLLRDLLTLDEAMVILVSCIPAIALLGRVLWREHRLGRAVLAPASMLSITTILLISNPLDSIPVKPSAKEWKHWLDIGAGGSAGNYRDISRDCDGNQIKDDLVKVNSGGGELNANWQRGWTKLQIGLRGTFGSAQTDENNDADNNYRYAAFGVRGEASSKYVGVSVGFFQRNRSYPNKVGLGFPATDKDFLPSGSLWIGRADRYSVDVRLFDEPALGFSNEPPFSMGLLNWGFNDQSGNSNIRLGFAVTSPGENAFALSGRFPLGKTGLSASLAAYLGKANIFSVGMRYQFMEW